LFEETRIKEDKTEQGTKSSNVLTEIKNVTNHHHTYLGVLPLYSNSIPSFLPKDAAVYWAVYALGHSMHWRREEGKQEEQMMIRLLWVVLGWGGGVQSGR